MRLPYLSLLLITIAFTSCDPDSKDIFNTEAVKLNGTISNNNETISLGDTLRIAVQVPDTIYSNTGVFPVQSLQRAQFYMRIQIVDTIDKKTTLANTTMYWTTKGSISSNNKLNFEFDRAAKPYGVTIYFKPPKKGLYYFEGVSQAGDIKINNAYEARLFVNFAVPDKHLHLIAPLFGGQAWLDEAVQHNQQGFGVYAFRVI